MSSSSSDDNEHMEQLLEVADCRLFDLYQQNQDLKVEPIQPPENTCFSQRYIESEERSEFDMPITKSMRDYVFKKITSIVEDSYEFIEFDKFDENAEKNETPKNILKLLRGADSFIETEVKSASPKVTMTKPVIKRRIVDFDTKVKEIEKISSVVVSGEEILNRHDSRHWAPQRIRNVSYYKMDPKGILCLVNAKTQCTHLKKK